MIQNNHVSDMIKTFTEAMEDSKEAELTQAVNLLFSMGEVKELETTEKVFFQTIVAKEFFLARVRVLIFYW